MHDKLANLSNDEYVELYALLCDTIYKAHVSKTPQEFREAVAEDEDHTRPSLHTSDVSRAAATHILRNILGIETEPFNEGHYNAETLERFKQYRDGELETGMPPSLQDDE